MTNSHQVSDSVGETVPGIGQFGHHPDPATDFVVEVEMIEAEIVDQRAGLSPQFDIGAKIERAMQFTVGGSAAAVVAKSALRAIDSAYFAGKAYAHENPTPQRLRGRAQWLRERGRIKDAELMETASAEIDFLNMSRAAISRAEGAAQ